MRVRSFGASRRVGSLGVCALMGVISVAAPQAFGSKTGEARSVSARTITLNESGRLRLTSKRSFTLNEKGNVTGTIKGVIYIHLHVVSINHVTAEINIYPVGGSLTGSASASYHSAGATASFAGTMSITRGSGSFAHARGSGLSFSGTVERANDAVTVRLSGRLTD
jgi:hypothetical protein